MDRHRTNANRLTPDNWQGLRHRCRVTSLVFTGVSGLNNTNNYPAATAFGGITFATPQAPSP